MASNDIKSTHDANPTGCDDVTADYYIQVVKDDGTISDEGMSVPQLRSILQVDPGADRDVFSLSLPDNTLEAIVGTLFGDYTHWQITESATAPLYTDINWISWPMPTILDWETWTTKTKYLYVKDTSIVYTILNSNGTSGITLTPVDTLARPAIDDLTASAIVSGTYDACTLSYTETQDPVPGSGNFKVELWQSTGGVPSALIEEMASSPHTVQNLGTGSSQTVVAVQYDVAENISVSNEATMETDTLTSATFTASNPTAGNLDDATITAWTPTIGEEPDGYIVKYNYGTTVPPSIADPAWLTGDPDNATPITLDATTFGVLPGFGDTELSGFVRIGSVVSEVSLTTVTASAAGGTSVVSFTTVGESVKEEFCPVATATVERTTSTVGAISVDYAITSVSGPVDGQAVAGIHYRDISGTLNWADTVSGDLTIDLTTLYSNLGSFTAIVNITLSNPVGCTVGGSGTYLVSIQGTRGYWGAGGLTDDIDQNNLPLLPLLLPENESWASGETVSHRHIDFTNSSLDRLVRRGLTSLTVENCIIENGPAGLFQLENSSNITFRNCVFRRSNKAGASFNPFGYALMFYGVSGDGYTNCKILNCAFEENNGDIVFYNYDEGVGHRIEYCHSTAMRDWRWEVTGSRKNTQFLGVQVSRNIGGTFKHNIMNCPNGCAVEDIINTYRSFADSTVKFAIHDIILQGSRYPGVTTTLGTFSGTGVQIGDVGNTGTGNETGYFELLDVDIMDQYHAFQFNSSGHHNVYRRLRFFNPPEKPKRFGTGIGMGLYRLGVSAPGQMHDCELNQFEASTYRETSAGVGSTYVTSPIDTSSHSLVGSDGLAPNHGFVGQAEQTVAKWWNTSGTEFTSGNHDFQKTEWDNVGSDDIAGHAGYDAIWPYLVMNPVHSDIPGIVVQGAMGYFSGGFGSANWNAPAVGYGVFTYNTADGKATWAEAGASAVAGIDVSADGDRIYYIASNNGALLKIYITAASLPTVGGLLQVDTYCVTSLKLNEVIRYAGTAGDFSVFNDPDNPPPVSSDPPTVPGIPTFDSATSTTITIDWTASTAGVGASIAGYEVYRYDNALTTPGLIDTVGNVLTYTDTTVSSGNDYRYALVAFDNLVPPQYSAITANSAIMNTSAAADILNPDGQFADSSVIDPTGNWVESRGVTTAFASGVCTMTNGTTNTGQLTFDVSGLIAAATDYKLTVRGQRISADMQIFVHETNNNPLNGDLLNDHLSDTVMTTNEYFFTSGATTGGYIMLRVFSTSIGQQVAIDFAELEAV